ncbi:MAG: hypothetical protein KBT47_08820 [Armatimonadetes bacterium]|nr:hypothetical protein [Candidatus Hippobium faecium]
MKFYFVLFVFILFSSAVFCQDDNSIVIAKTASDRMRDISGVRVLTEKFSPAFIQLGFSEENITDFVKGKLADNSCFDENADPYLYVNINPIQIDEKTLAASVHISLNRPVYYPAENKTFISLATLWQTGSIITFPADGTDYIYDILGKLMDKYIIEWYKSRIPYKEEIVTEEEAAPKEEIKEEPKKEGAVPDARELRRKGQAAA